MAASQHAVAMLSLVSVAAAEFFIGKIAEETLFIRPPDYFEDEPLFRFVALSTDIYPPRGGTKYINIFRHFSVPQTLQSLYKRMGGQSMDPGIMLTRRGRRVGGTDKIHHNGLVEKTVVRPLAITGNVKVR